MITSVSPPAQSLFGPPSPVERLGVLGLNAQGPTRLIDGVVVPVQFQVARGQVQVRGELLAVGLVHVLAQEQGPGLLLGNQLDLSNTLEQHPIRGGNTWVSVVTGFSLP